MNNHLKDAFAQAAAERPAGEPGGAAARSGLQQADATVEFLDWFCKTSWPSALIGWWTPHAAGRFPRSRTLQDFDWDFNRSIKKKPFLDLATGEFVRQGRNVLLVGPPGVGKPQPSQYPLCTSGM